MKDYGKRETREPARPCEDRGRRKGRPLRTLDNFRARFLPVAEAQLGTAAAFARFAISSFKTRKVAAGCVTAARFLARPVGSRASSGARRSLQLGRSAFSAYEMPDMRTVAPTDRKGSRSSYTPLFVERFVGGQPAGQHTFQTERQSGVGLWKRSRKRSVPPSGTKALATPDARLRKARDWDHPGALNNGPRQCQEKHLTGTIFQWGRVPAISVSDPGPGMLGCQVPRHLRKPRPEPLDPSPNDVQAGLYSGVIYA